MADTERAGTNKNYEFGGRQGLVRMLERAHLEPLNSATYQLSWQAAPDTAAPKTNPAAEDPDRMTPRDARLPAAKDVTYPIRYLMRTEIGRGPLGKLLLRNFVLPPRMFLVGKGSATAVESPLPACTRSSYRR